MSFYKKHEKKILLISGVLYFVIGFCLINFMTKDAEANILLTSLDLSIPFIPWFIIIYFSAFIMPALTYFLIKDMKLFRKTVTAFFAAATIGYAIFLLYPVKVVLRPDVFTTVLAPLYQAYYIIDPPYNAFPSLHVALPVIAGLASFHFSKRYWWMLVWAGLISASILFTKIHYVWDLVGGLVLGGLVYLLVFKRDKIKMKIKKIAKKRLRGA